MQQPNRSIVDTTLDSVTVINAIINTDYYSQETTDDKKNNVKRNVDHLVIMLSNDEFNSASTDLQKVLVNQIIEKGNTYISSL